MTKHRTHQYPRQVWGLFGTQAGERFAFYGMLAVLVLFLIAPTATGGAQAPPNSAIAIAGTAVGAVYILTLLGGWIADRLLGPQWMVSIGLSAATVGYGLLALPTPGTIWVGLVLALFGVSMFVPNINALIANEYLDKQADRDAAFSSLYVAVNVGGFAAPIVTGLIAVAVSWDAAFAINTIGTAFALCCFLLVRKKLNSKGRAATEAPTRQMVRSFVKWAVIALVIFTIIVVVDVLTADTVATETTILATALAVALPVIFLWRLLRRPDLTNTQRDRLRAYVWFFIAATLFWFMYSQKTGVLLVMGEQSVNRSIGDWQFPASWFQSLDPLFVVILGPPLASLWHRLGDRGPTTPAKFAGALACMGLSYLLLAWLTSDLSGTLVAWGWIVLVFLGMTFAELLLAPIGASTTTKLSPPGRESQMLAVWYLSLGAGYGLGGSLGALQTTVGYTPFFLVITLCALLTAAGFWLGRRPLLRGMHGIR